MEYNIKINDAFLELCKISEKTHSKMIDLIISGLDRVGFLLDWSYEFGKSINELLLSNIDHTINEIADSVFGSSDHYKNPEIVEFLGSIVLWGDGLNHPCVHCGCEMEGEEDGNSKKTWIDWNCPNPECNNNVIIK